MPFSSRGQKLGLGLGFVRTCIRAICVCLCFAFRCVAGFESCFPLRHPYSAVSWGRQSLLAPSWPSGSIVLRPGGLVGCGDQGGGDNQRHTMMAPFFFRHGMLSVPSGNTLSLSLGFVALLYFTLLPFVISVFVVVSDRVSSVAFAVFFCIV